MKTLKKIIRSYMFRVTLSLVTIILFIVLLLQIFNERRRTYENAMETLQQIEQVLEENQKELDEIQEEYRQTCLHNAEVIARIIEGNPEVVNDVNELKAIAASVEVDEIHIFDKTGRIYAGSHPQYFDYTFDSGEQMRFFKPMLKDKSLKMVQEITPNTAENKLMQYSALWSENKKFIVQVGMEPVNVTKVTKKNEMSYIFSLFRVNPEASYYAVDAETGEITGSTGENDIGKQFTEVGFERRDMETAKRGFYATVNGDPSFCVFKKIGSNYVGQVVSKESLYRRVPMEIVTLLICLTVVSLALIHAVIRHMNKYVVDEIHEVNEKLGSISKGNLDETVDIRSSKEFSELSDYINRMVKSLLSSNRKMSYVLSKTGLYIGVYEYNRQMGRVRFTKYIPQLFCLEEEEMEELSLDIRKFKAFMDELRRAPVPDEQGVYRVKEKYIRLGETVSNEDVFGIAVDVTAEITRRREIETERDIDALSGLYNRRGLDVRLHELFSQPDKLGHSAVIMIDADGLKKVNDTYGHESGDVYLQEIAKIIDPFGTKNSLASRQGGDEYILFLYGYDSEEELVSTIRTLESMQDSSTADIGNNQKIPVRFSFGYSLVRGSKNYHRLLREADEKMYQNKLKRRK